MYNECSAWDPRTRPKASEVVSRLEGCESEPLCDDIPLRFSQASCLEAFDKDLAEKITAGDSKIQQRMGPANDGTNACAFLCTKLAHDLHYVGRKEKWIRPIDTHKSTFSGGENNQRASN